MIDLGPGRRQDLTRRGQGAGISVTRGKVCRLTLGLFREYRTADVKKLTADSQQAPQRITDARLGRRQTVDVGLTAQPADVGVTPHNARGTAGHIGEDAIKQATIPPVGGPGGITNIFPRLVNDLLGTKIKIVGGYQGGNEIVLAIERGETGGRVMSWSTLKANKPDWIAEKKVNVLIAAGAKQPDLADTPRLEDLVKDVDDLRLVELVGSGDALGRPFVAPPDTPPDRLAALRAAFARMTADEEFRKDAAALKIDVDPTPHDELQRVVDHVLSTPKGVIERARKYF